MIIYKMIYDIILFKHLSFLNIMMYLYILEGPFDFILDISFRFKNLKLNLINKYLAFPISLYSIQYPLTLKKFKFQYPFPKEHQQLEMLHDQ